MNCLSIFLLVTVCACRLAVASIGKDAVWTSKVLSHPDFADGGTYQARALSQDDQGNMLIVVQKERSEQHESLIVLTKVDSSMNVMWTRKANTVRGNPFDMSYDGRESAYVVVSESKQINEIGRAHVIRFTNVQTQTDESRVKITERLVFSTPDTKGTTKFFGCVRHPTRNDLYVTGGTSTSLYRSSSLGKGDIIVVRLAASGQVMASIQFGSEDDEIGLSIAVSQDASALVVVAKRQFLSGLATSEIYRLDLEDLRILDGPHSPFNYGADPLFNPKSVTIVGPVASQPNTLVTFVGGDAHVKPDRQADIYIHIYATIQDRIKDVTVTFDGARNLKGVDACVSIAAAHDGNAYCLGYTATNSNPVSRRLNLIVVSPTGELLFRSERASGESVPEEETPAVLSATMSKDETKLLFIGQAKVRGLSVPTVGSIEIPSGTIRPFAGFNQIVTGAGTITKPESSVSTGQPSITVIAGGAVGGFAILVAIIGGLVIADRRRRLDHAVSKTTRTTRTMEDYMREVDESFTDAVSPSEKKASGGALV